MFTKTIAIIPARGGSKRLPNKNILPLGDRPLIAWTIQAAMQANVFDEIIVSTDDPNIATIANEWSGKSISRIRPMKLSKDDTPMLPVVKHIASETTSDAIFLLQPTSPFRTAEDIRAVFDLMNQSEGDAIVSVTDAPSDLVFQIGFANRMRPRTDIVVPNGAIYAISTDSLMRGEDWYSGISYAYRMPKDRSLDIDTEMDLELARIMIERRRAA